MAKKLKIIIIGSKGFIGKNTSDYFEKQGHEVYGCGVTEYPQEINYYQVDRFFPDYNNIFKKESFDICINASGSPGVGFSLENPQEDFRMNTSNVFSLLNSIRVYNPDCRLINLSSAAVYGNPKSLPIQEDADLSPLSPYGYHKMLTETLIKEFSQIYNLKTCSFRIFSAYGPGIKKQLLWDIYQKAISPTDGNKVCLFGKGNETRDFIFIEDLVEALSLVIEKDLFNGEVYNLGSGTETDIATIAQKFVNLINKELIVEFNGVQKEGDPLFWRSDISRLELLGFKTKTSLEEGLLKYYNWLNGENEK